MRAQRLLWVAFIAAGLLVGCAPTVKVAAPEEPIEINVNVKIEHEIRVKVDDELDEVFAEDSQIF